MGQLPFLFVVLASAHIALATEELFTDFDFSGRALLRDVGAGEENTPADQYEACRVEVNSNFEDNDQDDDPEHFDVAAVRPSEAAKSVIAEKGRKWAAAEIPTKLQDGMTSEQGLRLSCAIKYFEAFTCIKFTKYDGSQADYLYITKTDPRKGCFSEHIGKIGGRQILNLDSTSEHCWKHGTIVHELMHVLGFFHEQARNDRDDNIFVHWDNIPDQYEYQFKTAQELGIEQSLVGKYDYASIMHYGRFIWHLSQPTMTAKQPADIQYKFNNMMGNRARPTDMDTEKLITTYCPEPEDCVVSGWLTESNCSKPCGGGTQTLTRQILREGISTGKPCPSLSKTQECNKHKCPIDCEVSDWQQDGDCSATCGLGVQSLSRVVTKEAENSGRECPSLTSVIQCNLKKCTKDCIIETIADTPCSVTCGEGTIIRLRRVVQEASDGGKPCPEVLSLTLPCKTGTDCPVAEVREISSSTKDCVSEITSLTACSVSCGGGVQTKESKVVKAAQDGGKDCPPSPQTLDCNVAPCGTDCSFGWVDAGPCSASCDSGVKTLKPKIYKQSEGKGKPCPAEDKTQVVDCNLGPCDVNGTTAEDVTQLMLIGGEKSLDSYEFYNPDDPSKNTKKTSESFTGRLGHTAGIVGGKVLIFGGLYNESVIKQRRKRFYYDDYGGGDFGDFGGDDGDWGGDDDSGGDWGGGGWGGDDDDGDDWGGGGDDDGGGGWGGGGWGGGGDDDDDDGGGGSWFGGGGGGDDDSGGGSWFGGGGGDDGDSGGGSWFGGGGGDDDDDNGGGSWFGGGGGGDDDGGGGSWFGGGGGDDDDDDGGGGSWFGGGGGSDDDDGGDTGQGSWFGGGDDDGGSSDGWGGGDDGGTDGWSGGTDDGDSDDGFDHGDTWDGSDTDTDGGHTESATESYSGNTDGGATEGYGSGTSQGSGNTEGHGSGTSQGSEGGGSTQGGHATTAGYGSGTDSSSDSTDGHSDSTGGHSDSTGGHSDSTGGYSGSTEGYGDYGKGGSSGGKGGKVSYDDYESGDYFEDNGQYTGEVYDPESDKWIQAPLSNFGHIDGAGATISGAFYLCGGTEIEKGNPLQISHYYCEYLPYGSEWVLIPHMIADRSGHAAAALNNELYMLGGKDSNEDILDTVEKFNPSTKVWTSVASMRDKRVGGAAAVLNGKLYACGGKDRKDLRACEVYDSEKDRWKKISNLPVPRVNFHLVPFGDTLMALGNSLNLAADKVDVYDPRKNKWKTAKTRTIEKRSRFAVVLL